MQEEQCTECSAVMDVLRELDTESPLSLHLIGPNVHMVLELRKTSVMVIITEEFVKLLTGNLKLQTRSIIEML